LAENGVAIAVRSRLTGPVPPSELGAEVGEMVAHLGGTEDLDVFAEPSELGCDGLGRPAAELDLDPAIGRRVADREAGPEH
jgi:hypothetical protein